MQDYRPIFLLVGGLVVAGAAAAVLYSTLSDGGRGGGGGRGDFPSVNAKGQLPFPAATDPRAATQAAVSRIASGDVRTVGALVQLCRSGGVAVIAAAPTGDEQANLSASAAAGGAEGGNASAAASAGGGGGKLKLKRVGAAASSTVGGDAKSALPLYQLPLPYISYVRECFLRAAAPSASSPDGGEDGSSSDASAAAAATHAIAQAMFSQLVRCDEALRRLEAERATAFDGSNAAHASLLQQLWVASGRPGNTFARVSPRWAELGFQGDDPCTDLRGGGVLALRQLVRFAQSHPRSWQAATQRQHAAMSSHAPSWYMPAVTSIQLTALLLLPPPSSSSASASAAGGGDGGDSTTAVARFQLPHLEMIYDWIAAAGGSGGGGRGKSRLELPEFKSSSGEEGGGGGGAGKGKASPQEELQQRQQQLTAAAQRWRSCPPSDAEAGMFALHHALLLHFMRCWEEHQPPVMDYNAFLARTVLPSFFTAAWTLPPADASAP